MRVVLDTNIVISGLFWGSHPRRILESARSGEITLYTSQALLNELLDVLNRSKFAERLGLIAATPQEVVDNYAALVEVVEVSDIEPVVADDPDDDAVLACAIAANARYIVSGDSDLLSLSTYRSIQIVSATEFLARLAREEP
jgi:putative PIN family toxin of toxin-antitoxin system